MRRTTDAREQRREHLITEVIDIFQPRSPVPLTREDGREIYENLTGFFRTLLRIHNKRQAERTGGAA